MVWPMQDAEFCHFVSGDICYNTAKSTHGVVLASDGLSSVKDLVKPLKKMICFVFQLHETNSPILERPVIVIKGAEASELMEIVNKRQRARARIKQRLITPVSGVSTVNNRS